MSHEPESTSVQEAHRSGIDLSYRAPELPAAVRQQLPQPWLPGRADWIALYWRAWSIAYDKIRRPTPGSGLVPFCDAAFSEHLFQWDTCFMEQFLRFAPPVFCATGSLDNFYLKQHTDGFICREISSVTGKDYWSQDHLSAINPPLFADAEWQLYRVHGEEARLASVLGPLTRFHDWLRRHRRTADGQAYWTTLLASGMDNSPRAGTERGREIDHHHHFHHAWVCITAQQALAAHRIADMALILGDDVLARRLRDEAEALEDFIRRNMWNARRGGYSDLGPDGTVSDVLTPAMCWPLLLPDASSEHGEEIAQRLEDESTFWRHHAIPSLAADHALYEPQGNYWRGAVWPPMVYLTARSMKAIGQYPLAKRIAENHLENLSAVFQDTGTLWENYAPDAAAPGDISRPEFVGWTGCGAIALLIDTVLGLEVEAPEGRIHWRLDLQQDHGVDGLPIAGESVSLKYLSASHSLDVETSGSLDLHIQRGDVEVVFRSLIGKHRLPLAPHGLPR